ncbi:MAG TPA: hypothetical protein VFS44_08650 [Gemmatimonadaceae bacterium]|nr:hypothetical protein [Gemmatimonadaceae bacterium]
MEVITRAPRAVPAERPAVSAAGSHAPFLALIAYLAVVKLALEHLLPASFGAHALAAVFTWPVIGVVTAAGLVGISLAARTGFPGVWDPAVPLRERLALPASLGFALGAVAVFVDSFTGSAAAASSALGIPSVHVPFPAGALIYPGVAIAAGVLFHLLPLPLLLWGASRAGIDIWRRETAFVIAAVLVASVEPLAMDLRMRAAPGAMAALIAEDFVLGLSQLWVFRRAGFGASVVLRVVFYAVWHVAWPLL